MEPFETLAQRKPEEARLDDFVSRFEQACHGEQPADLLHFLPPPGDPARRPVLYELIKIDLEAHWRRAQRVELESYLKRFSELGKATDLPANLIYEEFRVRNLYGDHPALTSYEPRFPKQYGELKRIVRTEPLPEAAPATPRQSAPPNGLATICGLNQELPIGGGYRLIRILGGGGFAEVYEAEDKDGFPVAIKRVLRTLEHAEAQTELRALNQMKRLGHPYLLQTRGYHIHDSRLYIVMDLADATLSDRLKQCQAQGLKGIPVEHLVGYLREAAEALDYMHGKGIQHRDIKPRNILLHQGHAKVADFGLARLVLEGSAAMSVTGGGTAAYMAPEVWRGKISSTSDQYSLAVSYAELRRGRLPYPSTDFYGLGQDHLVSTPQLDPMGPAEQQVLLKALAKKHGERYASCREFAQAVEQAVAADRMLSEPPPAPPAPPPRPTYLRWQVSIGAVACLLMLALAVIFWPRAKVEPKPELPAGCQAEEGATIDQDYREQRFYNRIVLVLPDGAKVPFVLVRKRRADDPETFYIMQDKVTVGLFRRFAVTRPQDVKGRRWQDLAKDESQPILDVDVEDAYRFARWLGGHLPTTRQWDQAAGRYEDDPHEGPYERDWATGSKGQIAIDQERPWPVGQAARDKSPLGCRDMAGNGLEWTRNLQEHGREVPDPKAGMLDHVVLRGKSYRAAEPLRFKELLEQPSSQPYTLPDPTISFRAVIEKIGLPSDSAP